MVNMGNGVFRRFPLILVFFLVLYHVYVTIDDRKFRDKYRVHPDIYEASTLIVEEDDIDDSDACPEIQRLDALVENFERTQEWSLLLSIGDMYARGCFPRYSPDDLSALNIYMAASKCPDPSVSCEALSKVIDIRTNPISLEDRRGNPFPKETSNRLVRCVEDKLKRTPLSHYMRRIPPSTRAPRSLVNRAPVVTPVNVPEELDVLQPITPPEITHTPAYVLDTQNVHDHGVSASVRENIKSIVAELGTDTKYDRQELIESVMKSIRESGMKEKDLNNVFRVVVSLVPDKISSVGCSQMDVLNATFKKIQKIEDTTLRKNLIESLGKNLASGVERGNVVCSTGKIGRIITTLEGVESKELGDEGSTKIQKSVPIGVIRNEISTLASKIRNDVLSESSEKDVTDYNNLPNSKLSDVMNNRFRGEVKRIYVDELHLSEKVLNPIIDTYSSVF